MSILKSKIKKFMLSCGAKFYDNSQSKIVFYHDVFDLVRNTDMGTPLSMFKKHVDVVSGEGFSIVPRIHEQEYEVAVMFDDGFRGIYETKDYFVEKKICPTVFLAVSLIGKKGYLTKEEIKALQEQGVIFQCHSWSHENLTLFNDMELKRELLDSKNYLSDLLGVAVDEICLPIGYFSNHLLEEIKGYGYKEIYSSIPGNYHSTIIGGMRTRNLLQFSEPSEVRNVLHGGNELIKKRYYRMHYVK